jgi:ketosteroid isomerase-like protein
MSFHKAIKPGLLAVSLIALSACQPQKSAEAPEAAAAVPTDAEAAAIVDAAEAEWTSADTAKIMATYKEGGVWFDPVAVEPSADRAVQTKWTDGFTAMKLTEKSIAAKNVQVLDGDTIIASGIGTFKGAAQAEPISFRYTDVYEKQPDGKWLIVHEHLSAPPAEAAAAAKPAAEPAEKPAG